MPLFDYIQDLNNVTQGTNVAQLNLSNVGAGNLIIIQTYFGSSTTATVVVTDNNANVLSIGPNSVAGGLSGAFSGIFAAQAYFLASPGGDTTYTATWAGTQTFGANISAAEFTYYGTAAFDKDAQQNQILLTQPTPVTVPTITPAAAEELLVGFYLLANTPVGALNPWTNLQGIADGSLTGAYILNSTNSSTAANWGDNTTPDSFISMIAAFSCTPSSISIDNIASIGVH